MHSASRSSSVAQAKADYGDYYKTSLLYLACVDVETDLTEAERVQRAHDLALAALLSESIYNFGELVRRCPCEGKDGADLGHS